MLIFAFLYLYAIGLFNQETDQILLSAVVFGITIELLSLPWNAIETLIRYALHLDSSAGAIRIQLFPIYGLINATILYYLGHYIEKRRQPNKAL